jgi:hypothetical protein
MEVECKLMGRRHFHLRRIGWEYDGKTGLGNDGRAEHSHKDILFHICKIVILKECLVLLEKWRPWVA